MVSGAGNLIARADAVLEHPDTRVGTALVKEMRDAIADLITENAMLAAEQQNLRGVLRRASDWIAYTLRDDHSGEPWTLTRTLLNDLISAEDRLRRAARQSLQPPAQEVPDVFGVEAGDGFGEVGG